MHKRKIQLVAGSTFTVSIPKEWVKKNNLKQKSEIVVHEKADGTIVLSPSYIESKNLKELLINVDENIESIEQILFSVYYLGTETITLSSHKGFSKEILSRIRKTLDNMSGTEIVYEDEKKIEIQVFLDKTKVDVKQILHRMHLLIDFSFSNLASKIDKYEIRANEREIDRLYHLMAKMIHLSLIDSTILNSSKIQNIYQIPSYFLISKRLENIADNVFHLSRHMRKKSMLLDNHTDLIAIIRKEISKSINFILRSSKGFKKIDAFLLKEINEKIEGVRDVITRGFVKDIARYMADIEEEVVNISFYDELKNKGVL